MGIVPKLFKLRFRSFADTRKAFAPPGMYSPRPKLERLGKPRLQKLRQFRCCLKLRNRIQFLL
jgi:hypothetical protein